jgi:hypothetical protein
MRKVIKGILRTIKAVYRMNCLDPDISPAIGIYSVNLVCSKRVGIIILVKKQEILFSLFF